MGCSFSADSSTAPPKKGGKTKGRGKKKKGKNLKATASGGGRRSTSKEPNPLTPRRKKLRVDQETSRSDEGSAQENGVSRGGIKKVKSTSGDDDQFSNLLMLTVDGSKETPIDNSMSPKKANPDQSRSTARGTNTASSSGVGDRDFDFLVKAVRRGVKDSAQIYTLQHKMRGSKFQGKKLERIQFWIDCGDQDSLLDPQDIKNQVLREQQRQFELQRAVQDSDFEPTPDELSFLRSMRSDKSAVPLRKDALIQPSKHEIEVLRRHRSSLRLNGGHGPQVPADISTASLTALETAADLAGSGFSDSNRAQGYHASTVNGEEATTDYIPVEELNKMLCKSANGRIRFNDNHSVSSSTDGDVESVRPLMPADGDEQGRDLDMIPTDN